MNAAAGAALVAVRLPPGEAWLRVVRDIWDAGDAVLPLDPSAPADAIATAVDELRPHALIDASGRTAFEDGIPVEPDTAMVVTTSGSTGVPKGVVLSWEALRYAARVSVDRLGAGRSDRWLSCMPLHHVAGLMVLLRSEAMGVPPVVHERFDIQAVAAQRDVTIVSLVPTMLRRLLDAGADLRHLRYVVLGGAAPGAQLLADAAAAGVTAVTTYGMTETCGGCVYDGAPLDGVSVALDDAGTISIKGPLLFSDYRLRPDLTEAAVRDGWFTSADVGRWRDDGRLEILGRSDDIIITGGENVSAVAIAEVLETHPAIVEAAVIGHPDDEWGQRVVAHVVVQGNEPTLDELREVVRERLGRAAAPRDVVVVDQLPRLPSGKIDRLALR